MEIFSENQRRAESSLLCLLKMPAQEGNAQEWKLSAELSLRAIQHDKCLLPTRLELCSGTRKKKKRTHHVREKNEQLYCILQRVSGNTMKFDLEEGKNVAFEFERSIDHLCWWKRCIGRHFFLKWAWTRRLTIFLFGLQGNKKVFV